MVCKINFSSIFIFTCNFIQYVLTFHLCKFICLSGTVPAIGVMMLTSLYSLVQQSQFNFIAVEYLLTACSWKKKTFYTVTNITAYGRQEKIFKTFGN